MNLKSAYRSKTVAMTTAKNLAGVAQRELTEIDQASLNGVIRQIQRNDSVDCSAPTAWIPIEVMRAFMLDGRSILRYAKVIDSPRSSRNNGYGDQDRTYAAPFSSALLPPPLSSLRHGTPARSRLSRSSRSRHDPMIEGRSRVITGIRAK